MVLSLTTAFYSLATAFYHGPKPQPFQCHWQQDTVAAFAGLQMGVPRASWSRKAARFITNRSNEHLRAHVRRFFFSSWFTFLAAQVQQNHVSPRNVQQNVRLWTDALHDDRNWPINHALNRDQNGLELKEHSLIDSKLLSYTDHRCSISNVLSSTEAHNSFLLFFFLFSKRKPRGAKIGWFLGKRKIWKRTWSWNLGRWSEYSERHRNTAHWACAETFMSRAPNA